MADSSKPEPKPSKRKPGPGRPFQPGQSGNPGGRPAAEREIVEMARSASPRMMQRLIDIADNSEDENVAAMASKAVLARAYGKERERVTLGNEDDKPFQIEILRAGLVERFKKLAAERAVKPAVEPEAPAPTDEAATKPEGA